MNEPQIVFSGHVAAKPELRIVNGGTPVTTMRVATTPRKPVRGTDDWIDGETVWFNVTAWRQLAEHCVTSVARGDKVAVTGKLTTRTWQTEDGQPRTDLEVDAASVGLDLSRGNATSVKRSTPSQRVGETDGESDGVEGGPVTDDPWGARPEQEGDGPVLPGAGPLVDSDGAPAGALVG